MELCACFADGVESNWPIEEYGKVMAALDKPPNHPVNVRLADIMRSCM